MFGEGPKLPFASGVQQQQTQEMTRFVGAGFVQARSADRVTLPQHGEFWSGAAGRYAHGEW
jgi:hypothetical protein